MRSRYRCCVSQRCAEAVTQMLQVFAKMLLLLSPGPSCDWPHSGASHLCTGRGVFHLVCLRRTVTRQTDNASKYRSIDDRITRIIRLCSVSGLQLSARLLSAGRHFFSCSFTFSTTSVTPVMLLGDSAGLATTGVRLSALKLDACYSFDEGFGVLSSA